MPNQPLYPGARAFDGDVLILCEGDAVGYETQLLKLWADETDLGGKFVKVLACGTGSALYGVADAVGRTIPVIVLEDRDFRTVEEAKKECSKNLKNRESRNVAMRGWFAWTRAEIENYFVDDEVLPGTFSAAFECGPDKVRDALVSAISTLFVSQALEYARYRLRKRWSSTDSNVAFRISPLKWEEDRQVSLTATEVRDKLEQKLQEWQRCLHDGDSWEDPMSGTQLLDDFESKCQEWSMLGYESDVWRRDWACKEVLKHVRMKLASAKGGWWSHPSAPNAGVPWAKLNGDKDRDAHDRIIERQVQRSLVEAVAHRVKLDTSLELRADLEALADTIRDV